MKLCHLQRREQTQEMSYRVKAVRKRNTNTVYYCIYVDIRASQVALLVKEAACQCARCKRFGFDP